MRIGNTLAAFKTNVKDLLSMSKHILSLAKLKGKKVFFGGCKKGVQRDATLKSTWLLQEIKKISPFVKFENTIPPLLLIRSS